MKVSNIFLLLATLFACTYATTTPLVWSEIQALKTNCLSPEPPAGITEIVPEIDAEESNENGEVVEGDAGEEDWANEEWDEEDFEELDNWEENQDLLEEWEEDYIFFGYDCDVEECQAFMTELESQLAAATAKIAPCLEWDTYMATTPDNNNLDSAKVLKYAECLVQKGDISINFPANEVYYCWAQSTADYLTEHGYQQEITEAEINTCKAQCDTEATCSGSECSDFITDNWDSTIDICSEVMTQKGQDFTDSLTSAAENFTYSTSLWYSFCVEAQLEENVNFDIVIDYDTLEDTYDDSTDTYDFSDLTVEQKSLISLECQIDCYHYEEEHYDNEDVLIELYGENYYEMFEEFDDEEEEAFWDEDDFEDFDCEGDDCFNESGDFIGQVAAGKTNACDGGYCFAELWGCIDSCQKDNCPSSSCYTDGNNLEKLIEEKCLKFSAIKRENQEASANDSVEPKYYESYKECITKLSEDVAANPDSNNVEKQAKQTAQYTCFNGCADKIKQNYEENNGSSCIMFYLVGLIIALII